MDEIRSIIGDGFAYLASPYTLYPGGHQAAFEEVSCAGRWLLDQGVVAFVPIAHTHPMAIYAGESAPHDFWMNADRPFMASARCLIVCMMPGWRESRGVTEEIAVFRAAGKPVVWMKWPPEVENAGFVEELRVDTAPTGNAYAGDGHEGAAYVGLTD